MRKEFFRLYYRRHRRFTTSITGLSCTNGSDTIDKAGAHFNTEGHADQLFVGDTVIIDSITYRVVEVVGNTEFELEKVFESATSTYTGTFTTPALSITTATALMSECDDYWAEFFKAEVGASLKVDPGDNVIDTMGNKYDVNEVVALLFNVMGTEDYESSPNKEGRWDELRLALQNQPTDILLFNDNTNNPSANIYYDIQGNVQLNALANDIRRIVVDMSENQSVVDENILAIPKFTVETPVWTPDSGAVTVSVVLSCANKQAKVWYGKYENEAAFLTAISEGNAIWFIGGSLALSITVAGNYFARGYKGEQMTISSIGTAVYTA